MYETVCVYTTKGAFSAHFDSKWGNSASQLSLCDRGQYRLFQVHGVVFPGEPLNPAVKREITPDNKHDFLLIQASVLATHKQAIANYREKLQIVGEAQKKGELFTIGAKYAELQKARTIAWGFANMAVILLSWEHVRATAVDWNGATEVVQLDSSTSQDLAMVEEAVGTSHPA